MAQRSECSYDGAITPLYSLYQSICVLSLRERKKLQAIGQSGMCLRASPMTWESQSDLILVSRSTEWR